MTDNDSILFPSVTICKDEMFEDGRYSSSYTGFLSLLHSGEVSAENLRPWFLNRTFSRGQLGKDSLEKYIISMDLSIYWREGWGGGSKCFYGPTMPRNFCPLWERGKGSWLGDSFFLLNPSLSEVPECEDSGGSQQLSLQYREWTQGRGAMLLSLPLPWLQLEHQSSPL